MSCSVWLASRRIRTHHDNVGVFWQRLGDLDGSPDGVRRLEGGDDTFELGAETESSEGFLVVGDNVFGPSRVLQPGVLGTDTL